MLLLLLPGCGCAIREFIGTKLVEFAEKHQHVSVRTELKRNKHPTLTAEYCEEDVTPPTTTDSSTYYPQPACLPACL